jgi:anaerobic selenocysteine-containing dehydrogenase
MVVHGKSSFPAISPNEFFPVNKGSLCIKGWTAAEVLNHPERLLRPLARNAAGRLSLVSWEEAYARIVAAIEDTQARHGRDAVALASCICSFATARSTIVTSARAPKDSRKFAPKSPHTGPTASNASRAFLKRK